MGRDLEKIQKILYSPHVLHGLVTESVYVGDLKSPGASHVGSSPTEPTKNTSMHVGVFFVQEGAGKICRSASR